MISYLQIDKLTKSFGDLVLFEDITFGIAQGQKVGLIAKNGTGKTTLLNIIAGKEDYDSGAVVFRNDLRVGYLEQMPHYPDGLTVLQACFYSPNETVRLIAEYEQAMASGDHSNLEDILLRMDNLKAWDYEQRAKQILGQLKIHNFDQKVETLSGGQLKRVALANVLITDPELIILDEPTNHLDLEMTEWLEGYLSRANISILMVTHDRYFLDRVCSEIIEIDRKQIYQYKGNYSYYLEKRQERMDALNAEVDRASNLLRKELDWMRRQPQARGTKAKYRIDAFYELEKKAKQQHEVGNVNLDVKASYIGSKIFEAEHVSKRFGDLKIVEDFNYIFARYEKMGIVGNNGTGKSTFINSFAGKACAKTGNKPGVTKGNQWIRLNKTLELLDTPGILWPRFEDQQVGLHLALIGSINDQILNKDELACELISLLEKDYPQVVKERFGIEDVNEERVKVLEEIARNRACLMKGGELDLSRAAALLLDDFRGGKLGRISLEKAEDYKDRIKVK